MPLANCAHVPDGDYSIPVTYLLVARKVLPVRTLYGLLGNA